MTATTEAAELLAGTAPGPDDMQSVYDLIIACCEHDPKWHRKGADALRVINRTIAEKDAVIAGLVEHAETRTKDGDEMGARVWRIALEDIVREARAALTAAKP